MKPSAIDPNRRRCLRLLAAAPLLTLAGCAREPTTFIEEGFTVFHAPVLLKFANVEPGAAQAVLSEAEAYMQPFYQRIHPWKDSDLTRLNARLKAGETVQVDEEMLGLLREGKRLSQMTDGVFDPAAGELFAKWGFHSNHPERDRKPPPESWLAAWRADVPRMDDLVIEGDRVRSTNPRLQLDLNAMAEGMAARHVLARATAVGVNNMIFDPGGDLGVLGRAGDRPWSLGIRDPFGSHGQTLAGIMLEGRWGLFSSGTYEKRFRIDGKDYSHLLNPTTGWPAREIVGSTVLHADPVVADAAATALTIIGPQQAVPTAQRLGLSGFAMVDVDRHLYLSASWADRLKLVDKNLPVTVLTS
ncbi:MAG: FAD:protein FMN transferase [Halothiobacillaceae bacterium]